MRTPAAPRPLCSSAIRWIGALAPPMLVAQAQPAQPMRRQSKLMFQADLVRGCLRAIALFEFELIRKDPPCGAGFHCWDYTA